VGVHFKRVGPLLLRGLGSQVYVGNMAHPTGGDLCSGATKILKSNHVGALVSLQMGSRGKTVVL